MADRIAATIGSWRFLGAQSMVMAAWIAFQCVGIFKLHWDPYPFILLNLLLSTQAAFTGPVLQLTQNRQAAKDRDVLEHTFRDAERIWAGLENNTSVTLAIARHLELEVDELLATERTPDAQDSAVPRR